VSPAPGCVPFGEALRVWCRIALLSFGGPAAQIAVMHRILVDEKRWLDEERFLHALNYCMLLPGPEAQQLATYSGWLLHRTLGGLCAGLMFVLPGFVSILVLSIVYAVWQQTTVVTALFFGLKPAVMAIVVEALLRIGKRALRNRAMVAIAAAAFVALFFFAVPFPFVVVAAAVLGVTGAVAAPTQFVPKAAAAPAAPVAAAASPPLTATLRTAAVWLTIWLLPLWLLARWLGADHVLAVEARFFSQTAVVTFGGAYSVLSYIAQQAVDVHGWLRPGEMLDGLGMAENTPGPLIQVVQFVGFLGAYRQPAPFDPVAAGVLGSVVTTWATFAPCFLWIFVGAPYVEFLRGRRLLSAALSAITAAVVGVILNLALWFLLHTLFATVHERSVAGMRLFVPDVATFDALAAAIGLLAAWLLLRRHVGMGWTLLAAAGVGMILHTVLRG
jgi:chromate transporter